MLGPNKPSHHNDNYDNDNHDNDPVGLLAQNFFLMGLVPSRDVDSKTKIIRSENISKNSSIAIL